MMRNEKLCTKNYERKKKFIASCVTLYLKINKSDYYLWMYCSAKGNIQCPEIARSSLWSSKLFWTIYYVNTNEMVPKRNQRL